MNYPKFFDDVPTITLQDPLSDVLGTFEDGIVEFSYLDIVKASGHSCPTVAGAYLVTFYALKELYVDSMPKRGDIKVAFENPLEEGVTGVIANVITHITGATQKSGFKGLNGKFARHSLMEFEQKVQNIAFTRKETNQTVEVTYNPSSIAPNPQMQPLMQKVMQGTATKEEKKLFGELWQERVEKILLQNSQSLILISSIK